MVPDVPNIIQLHTYPSRNKFIPPGFIVGVARSGTTLLSAILNRHPEICVTPETEFFLNLYKEFGGQNNFIRLWPDSVSTIVDKMLKTEDWDNPSPYLLKRLAEKNPDVGLAFKELGNMIAESKGKRLWLEKTPRHIRYLEQIRQIFLEAPILHIVRDGRDVAHSLLQVAWASNSYMRNLYVWREELKKSKKFLISDKHVATIRYEDLVLHPERVTRKICEFLGVEYYSRMLEPDGSEKDLIEISGHHKTQVLEKISSEKINKWKSWATKDEKLLADFIAGFELKSYGYETTRSITNNPRYLFVTKNLMRSKESQEFLTSIFLKYASFSSDNMFGGVASMRSDNIEIPNDSIFITDEDMISDVNKKQRSYRTFLHIIIRYLRIRKLLRLLRINNIKLVWICRESLADINNWLYKKMVCRAVSRQACLVILERRNKNIESINEWAQLLQVSPEKLSSADELSLFDKLFISLSESK